MGLSKSKAEKSVQQGFPNQPGFSTAPGQFPSFASPSGAFGSQSFPATASGFGAPGFSSQASFPPFPAQMPGQMGGFSNNQIFGQAPLVSSSNFPVSYPGQPFRPLIPGYAPAPGNERRDQQMGQMIPQVQPGQQQGKARKH
ncbi:hypothetical protein BpHYR1_016831 [Brachionus plicatilis]|uniref:Uncharacterized protein n=1 Tax=Brachionus plicatilis TaxID=10195 RepID=A0A3M7PFY1_BRAPC|nr:hypothetical protein BpHYR1_016831 [Brachionus plicatilis]